MKQKQFVLKKLMENAYHDRVDADRLNSILIHLLLENGIRAFDRNRLNDIQLLELRKHIM